EVDKINLYYPNINYKIKIKKDENSREILFLDNLLYSIFRKEFLILKKTFRNFFNKGFIHINNSLAIIPVLFI
ncbi:hypothetical protein NEUTE2DRAFT_63619, partial [Neurospora tetrasperma FGSC 2509]